MSMAYDKRKWFNRNLPRFTREGDADDAWPYVDITDALFYRSSYAKEGYEIDGESCTVAEYPDGSMLAYLGWRKSGAALLLKGETAKDARRFLRAEGEGTPMRYGYYWNDYYRDRFHRYGRCVSCGRMTGLDENWQCYKAKTER